MNKQACVLHACFRPGFVFVTRQTASSEFCSWCAAAFFFSLFSLSFFKCEAGNLEVRRSQTAFKRDPQYAGSRKPKVPVHASETARCCSRWRRVEISLIREVLRLLLQSASTNLQAVTRRHVQVLTECHKA